MDLCFQPGVGVCHAVGTPSEKPPRKGEIFGSQMKLGTRGPLPDATRLGLGYEIGSKLV